VSEPQTGSGASALLTGSFGTVPAGTTAQQLQAEISPALEGLLGTAAAELELQGVENDPLGRSHLRYRQRRSGLEVVGGTVIVHLDRDGQIYALTTSGRADVRAPAIPRLDANAALEAARSLDGYAGFALETPRLVYVIANGSGRTHLAWELMAVGARGEDPAADLLFIDAFSGELAEVHPRIFTGLSRRMHTANHTQTLPGALLMAEGGSSSNSAVVDAYANAGAVHAFFRDVFNRDSYDGKGAALVASVHVGMRYNNAYWDGRLRQMAYGDGDGSQFSALSSSLDVAAHELTHAVTDLTAGLVYQNESGALNEAYSDILGIAVGAYQKGWAIDSGTWMLAEDCYTPNRAGDALRYMDNPSRDGDSRDFYPERYTGASDNGGVHINSGIANLAFKMLATGGVHPRNKTAVRVPSLGLESATRIYYRALTSYLSTNSSFTGARSATAQAADDLYGPAGRRSVELSWASVGVGEVPGPTCVNNDTFCDPGCAPVDTDCFCAADGACTTQCADLSRDPDCPADCAVNDVCAVESCPVPDPDCVEVGQACSGELQCRGRLCVAESMSAAAYCSQSCKTTSDCPGQMVCAPSGACQYRMSDETASIRSGGGLLISGDTDVVGGCAAAGGGPVGLLAALLALLALRLAPRRQQRSNSRVGVLASRP
jgi:Zn-dependent metalloprotease